MNITSYFIGIALKNEYFSSLYKDLNEYSLNNRIENTIELQNNNSLHVTLYYLDKNISDEIDELRNDINMLKKNEKEYVLFIEENKYFKRNNQDFLSYLSIQNPHQLITIHDEISQKYKKNSIPDNHRLYIPHISLFKILDYEKFEKHREKVEQIAKYHIENLKVKNILNGFYVFAVDSTTKPETQIPIEI